MPSSAALRSVAGFASASVIRCRFVWPVTPNIHAIPYTRNAVETVLSTRYFVPASKVTGLRRGKLTSTKKEIVTNTSETKKKTKKIGNTRKIIPAQDKNSK